MSTFDFKMFTAQVIMVIVFWLCTFEFVLNDGKSWGENLIKTTIGRSNLGLTFVGSGSGSESDNSVGNRRNRSGLHLGDSQRMDIDPAILQQLGRDILNVPSNTASNLHRREQHFLETLRMFHESEEMGFYLPYEARPRRSKHYSHPYSGGQYVIKRYPDA